MILVLLAVWISSSPFHSLLLHWHCSVLSSPLPAAQVLCRSVQRWEHLKHQHQHRSREQEIKEGENGGCSIASAASALQLPPSLAAWSLHQPPFAAVADAVAQQFVSSKQANAGKQRHTKTENSLANRHHCLVAGNYCAAKSDKVYPETQCAVLVCRRQRMQRRWRSRGEQRVMNDLMANLLPAQNTG